MPPVNYPGGQYRGFGAYPEPPPERDRRTLVVVGAAAALVLLVGAIAAVLLLTRSPGTTTAGPDTTTAPVTTTTSTRPEGREVRNSAAKLRYQVPASWSVDPDAAPITLESVPGVTLTGLAGLAEYRCGGKVYSRGVVDSATVEGGEVNQRASDLARAFGAAFYRGGTGVQVDVGTPRAVTRRAEDGSEVTGAQVDATITTSGDDCLAVKGRISVLLLEHRGGLRLLLVNGDLEGGPATPLPADPDDLAAITDSGMPAG